MHPNESLDIISKMMNDTRISVMRGASTPLLVWGWVSFGVSMIVYFARILTGSPYWDFAWFLIPVIGLPLLQSIRPKKRGIHTAISRSLGNIWKMLTVLIVIFSISSFIVRFNVLSIILLILAIGSYITGELIHYPFLKYSSIPGFILAASLWWVTGLSQIQVFGIAMVVMMIIPAYKIKSQFNQI